MMVCAYGVCRYPKQETPFGVGALFENGNKQRVVPFASLDSE